MTILHKIAITTVFTLVLPVTTLAATDPGLGAAASFSVLAQTGITGTGTISGNVENNGIAAAITALTTAMVGGTIYSSDAGATGGAAATTLLNAAVQADASTAYTTNIPGQGATGSIGPVLDGLTVTPGVYDVGAGRLNGGVLHLNGPGIYIFRASSDFISSGSIDLQNGARACDVFWRVQTLATINGSSFTGTILSGTGVHFGANVTLDGRALAVGGDVTMLTNTISGPSCALPPAGPVPTGGGTGMRYYERLPAIAITKTPSPLNLPSGPGNVTYTYAVTNIGKVALNTVWVKDNKCSPTQYVSGDSNSDGMLDLTETWVYTCSKLVSQTETNIATTHGWGVGLGMDVYATATATVTVTAPTGLVLGVSTSTIPVVYQTPGFPDTGLPPYEDSLWDIITIVGILMAVTTIAVVLSKRTT